MKHPPPTYGRPHPKARFQLDAGYPRFLWKEGHDSHSIAVHRWVWEHFNGPIPPGHYVRFKDGDRWNWAIENLELVTGRDIGLRRIATVIKRGWKTCTACGQPKPLSAFRLRQRASGLSPRPECKECQRKYARAYRRRPEVRLATNERRRRRQAERRGS